MPVMVFMAFVVAVSIAMYFHSCSFKRRELDIKERQIAAKAVSTVPSKSVLVAPQTTALPGSRVEPFLPDATFALQPTAQASANDSQAIEVGEVVEMPASRELVVPIAFDAVLVIAFMADFDSAIRQLRFTGDIALELGESSMRLDRVPNVSSWTDADLIEESRLVGSFWLQSRLEAARNGSVDVHSLRAA